MKYFRQISFLLLLIPGTAFSQWTDDPNNPLALCTATNSQSTVAVAGDNNNGFLVFWIDQRDAVAGEALYAQHLDADGNLLWQANGKNIFQTAGKNIVDFKMANWQEGVIVVWIQSSGGYPDSMFCQYFDTSGEALWSQPEVIATASNGIISLDVPAFNVFPNSFGATIAYSYIYTGGAEFFCFNRIDFSGNLAFPINNFAITYGTYYNFLSCSDNMNGVYALMKGNGYGSGMVIQRYDAMGSAVFATPVDISAIAGGLGGRINVNSDASGSLYVTWDSFGSNGIVTTKLNANGNFTWSPSYRDVSDYNSGQSSSYSILVDDKLYVTWNDNRPNASNAYIYMQKIDTSGVIEWTSGGVLACTLNNYIPVPKLVASDSGSVVATYEVGAGFLAQKFRPDSTIKLDINGEPISTSITPFYGDYVLMQSSGGCVAAFWASDEGDIYAGRSCTEQTNVGVNEVVTSENSICVFPNPSSSGIFEITLAQYISDSRLKVLDVTGRNIIDRKVSGSSLILDLSSLSVKGSYILAIITDDGVITRKLLFQ